MNTRAAVVVGVNKTGGLAPLKAAVSGARQVEGWLKVEGFEVTRLDDDDAPVRVGQVKEAVKGYLDRLTFEQLVVYFAGHGYLSGSGEVWLLSGAPDDPDDAVDLTASADLARSCGVRSIVFISDACRSVPPSLTGSRVWGSSIFPNRNNDQVEAEIDRFFATRPGDPALELPIDEARASYVGLFTEMLRRLHRDPDQSLVRTIHNGGVDMVVVPCRRMKEILPERVNEAAQERSIRLRQKPQLRLECGEDTFIARAEFTESGSTGVAISGAVAGLSFPLSWEGIPEGEFSWDGLPGGDDGTGESLRRGAAPAGSPKPDTPSLADPTQLTALPYRRFAYSPEIQSAILSDPGFVAAANRVAEADLDAAGSRWAGGGRFAGTGIQVAGATVTWTLAIGMVAKHHGVNASSASVIQLHGEGGHSTLTRPGSVILQFGDGSGTVLAGLPGYTASVTVEEGRVINVSYVPSMAVASRLRWEYESRHERIDLLRAVAATAARNGFLATDRKEAKRFASLIRVWKRIDPTLGLYAALTYADLGLQADARSVLYYMRRDLDADLFDVALLAAQMPVYPDPGPGVPSQLRPRAPSPLDSPLTVPFCPMLGQSWSYLRPRGIELPLVLGEAGRHRRPALWTTFDPDGMALLRGALEQATSP